MFEALHAHLVSHCSIVAERAEGVAFLRAAKELYQLASINYVCINISATGRPSCFAHCIYSDTGVKQFMSKEALRLEFKNDNGFASDSIEVPANGAVKRAPPSLTLALRKRRGETAFFGILLAIELSHRTDQQETVLRECRILANYFHGHILRINGHDSEREILISARELDCLKWTAAGKTALEASIILGISERTVRFHLNAGREKLDCTTTTQAVAKAISNQLIEL